MCSRRCSWPFISFFYCSLGGKAKRIQNSPHVQNSTNLRYLRAQRHVVTYSAPLQSWLTMLEPIRYEMTTCYSTNRIICSSVELQSQNMSTPNQEALIREASNQGNLSGAFRPTSNKSFSFISFPFQECWHETQDSHFRHVFLFQR